MRDQTWLEPTPRADVQRISVLPPLVTEQLEAVYTIPSSPLVYVAVMVELTVPEQGPKFVPFRTTTSPPRVASPVFPFAYDIADIVRSLTSITITFNGNN